MSSPGFSRGWKKGARTVAQVAAGGALTALVTALAGGLAPTTQALVMGAWIAVVAFCQNWAEGAGKIGVLLPTPALVVGPAAGAVATVEATADHAGEIVGDVLDTAGDVVGEVVGQLAPDRDEESGGAGLVALFVIVFFVLLAAGGFATCDLMFDDESEPGDNHLLGRAELVSHGDDGDDQRYDQRYGSEDDQNRHRDRNRGAFSPGPFDDSPVDAFNGNVICLPGSTCYADDQQRERDPDESADPVPAEPGEDPRWHPGLG